MNRGTITTAAVQHFSDLMCFPCGIAAAVLRQFELATPVPLRPMASEFHILGVTENGSPFRPSDWAERLAGVMSCFRPGAASTSIGARIGYSPWCEPRIVDGIRCVRVSDAIRQAEPMAWDFVMNFARDNGLRVTAVHDDIGS